MSRSAKRRFAGGSLLAFLVAGGCEQAFEPLQDPGDLYFSVHALLDASADTQWVRVMPIRPTIHTSGVRVDAKVTLQDLEDGRLIIFRDSVFSYRRELGAELVAHNFWTDERLRPGATYRFSAVRSDGATSEAIVPMPRDFPTVVVGYYLRRDGAPPMYARPWVPDYVRIPVEVEHPAMVRVIHHVPQPCQVGFSTTAVFQPAFSGGGVGGPIPSSGRVNITNVYDRTDTMRWFWPVVPCDRRVHRWELALTASGVRWPFGSVHSLGTIAHPDFASNVSNAIGFVGGILTRRIPYEACLTTFAANEHCELTYGPDSATLRGRVRDLTCDRPVDRAYVLLRQRDGPRYRPTYTDPDGTFSIGALEAREYRLEVEAPVSGFHPHQEVLAFGAGQLRSLDVGLVRETDNCPF